MLGSERVMMERKTNEFGCFREIIVPYCGCDELARFLGLKKDGYLKNTLYGWRVNTIGAGGSTEENVSQRDHRYIKIDLPYLRTVWSFFRLIWE